MLRTRVLLVILLVLTACTYGRVDLGDGKYTQASAITGQGGTYKVGKPYKIMGKWYYPKEDYDYSEVGIASWYGEDFHAKTTANGERYDMYYTYWDTTYHVVNYDIQDVKLSYSEPIQRLENDKTSTFFLDVVQNQEQAQEFFIRDFDVCQYDNERIREDITNLYHHYVNDYFAFVDSNSLHDGATLRSLRQSMMMVYDSLDEYRSGNTRPYGGAYAIRNPRNNQQPMVLTYFTTNGERGNLLRRGGRLTSTNAAVGDVEALIDATGGRNKIRDIKTRKQLAKHIVNSNDRLFTKIDLLQYCKMEFMRAFGEEAIGYCNISLSESNIPVDGHIEKCLNIHFNIISEVLKEEVNNSDFFNYLKINIELRKSFSWKTLFYVR